jgi:hypothetical protein
VSPPEQWRFQWPDGTWIRWNPDTEAWEKEISGADGDEPRSEVLDIAPEERWLLDSLEPPAEPAVAEPGGRTISAEITVGPDFAVSSEADEDLDDEDIDDDNGWGDDAEQEVALGPRSSAPHVIAEEEPKSSLRPTIIAGAAVGLAVGIVVSMMLR